MTKKPRENRVPIMMSEEELTAIDDWRFANRIATRSEAIRRLAASGIKLHAGANDFVHRSAALWEDIDAIAGDIEAYIRRLLPFDADGNLKADEVTRDQAVALAVFYSDINDKLTEDIMEGDKANYDYVKSCLAVSFAPEYSDLTPFKRTNEWLRQIFGEASKHKS